jgi:uncharacterized membrane protein
LAFFKWHGELKCNIFEKSLFCEFSDVTHAHIAAILKIFFWLKIMYFGFKLFIFFIKMYLFQLNVLLLHLLFTFINFLAKVQAAKN